MGASAYCERHEAEITQHVMGSESDFGGVRLVRRQIARLRRVINYLPRSLGYWHHWVLHWGSNRQPGGGPDLYPLIAAGVFTDPPDNVITDGAHTAR